MFRTNAAAACAGKYGAILLLCIVGAAASGCAGAVQTVREPLRANAAANAYAPDEQSLNALYAGSKTAILQRGWVQAIARKNNETRDE